MKTNKKIGASLFVASLMAAFFVSVSMAGAVGEFGEPPTKPPVNPTPEQIEASMANEVATVGISETKIVSQQENVFNLSFDIANDRGVQPQLKYVLQLVQLGEDGQQYIVDEKVSDEILNLGPQEVLHKETIYTAPAFLQGKFELWLTVKNGNGLLVALNKIGEVEFSGSGDYAEILPESCFLSVAGEAAEKKYFLDQGVDVAKEENLFLNCTVRSHASQESSVIPVFTNFWRNSAGPQVGEQKLTPIVLAANADTTIKLEIPKAEKPQAYDAVLKITDAKGEAISIGIIAHYVIRGVSATIENLSFDKDYYAQGENASLFFNWTPSADSFPEARVKSSNQQDILLELAVMSNGKACGELFKKQLTTKAVSEKVTFFITNDCLNPEAKVILKDLQGNMLDQGVFAVTSNNLPDEKKTSDQATPVIQKQSMKNIAMTIAAILVLLGIAAILFFKRRSGKVLSLLMFMTVSMLIGQGAGAISWDLWRVDNGDWVQNHYVADISPTVVNPGGAIAYSGNASLGNCGNGKTRYDLYISANGVYGSFVSYYGLATTATIYGSGTFYAPSTPGNYSASFLGWGYGAPPAYAPAVYEPGWHAIGYRVRGCGDGVCEGGETCSTCPGDCKNCPNISISATPVACGSQSTTVTWSNSGGAATQCWAQCYIAATGTPGSCPGFDNPSSGTAPYAGTYAYNLLTENTRFDVTCANSNGTSEARVTATIGVCPPDPTLGFTFGDGTTNKTLTLGITNPTFNLNWTPTDSNWCWAESNNSNNDFGWTNIGDGDVNGDWKASGNVTHSQALTPIVVGSYDYRIKCGNSVTGKETVLKSVTLKVDPCVPNGTKTNTSCDNGMPPCDGKCTPQTKIARCIYTDSCGSIKQSTDPTIDCGLSCTDTTNQCFCAKNDWIEVTP